MGSISRRKVPALKSNLAVVCLTLAPLVILGGCGDSAHPPQSVAPAAQTGGNPPSPSGTAPQPAAGTTAPSTAGRPAATTPKQLKFIHMYDVEVGIALDGEGRILRTSDGGRAWGAVGP